MTPEKFAERRALASARAKSDEYREKQAELRRATAYREKQASRVRSADYRRKNAAYLRTLRASDTRYREKQAAYIKHRRDCDPKFRAQLASRERERRANDPLYAAKARLRNRTRAAFRRISADKPASTEELLGTDWQTLKAHIESQFVDGMNWENMSDWHIDHIIPLASAKTEEELAALCHYTNLQPLFALDNLTKGTKLPHELP